MDDFHPMRLNRSVLSNDAAKLIRKMILSGRLKPGERINEVQLAKQMQVSRGPIREALLVLQTEGLVTYEVNRGTSVSTLSSVDAWEVYTMRALLEGEAAKLALPRLKEKEFQQLESILREFDRALQERDMERLISCDISFHRVIVDAANHSRMTQTHQQMDPLVAAMFMTISNNAPLRVPRVVEIHAILLDVLRSADDEQVEQAFRAHYMDALHELQIQLGQKQG